LAYNGGNRRKPTPESAQKLVWKYCLVECKWYWNTKVARVHHLLTEVNQTTDA
jgi:hypothetical protein